MVPTASEGIHGSEDIAVKCGPIIAFLLGLLAAVSGRAAETERLDLGVPEVRRQAVERLERESRQAKAAAWAQARREGWRPRKEANGRIFEVMAIRNGRVIAYVTTNVNAAISTAANLIRNTSPYNLNGAGLSVGIWDGGLVRSTHQELTGRTTLMDAGSVEDHSTHIAGTIGAAGVNADAEGMAPSVAMDSYDWTDDIAEVTSRAMSYAGEPGTIQISNHSYGFAAGWQLEGTDYYWYGTWGNRESESFGIYDTHARDWDVVCADAPYYLPFKSAGNDRIDDAPPAGTLFYYFLGHWRTKTYDPDTDPYDDGWDNGGFDTTPMAANAKNLITVGAVKDAVSAGVRSLGSAAMSPFSGWGPTDDGRIKPDIVANGVSVYSTKAASDSSYGWLGGTSMATANATGSAALLVEYYGELFPGQFMRASTIKGLIIHTADDLGRPGPDYSFGWGLMNVKAAADHMERHHADPAGNRIVEDALDGTHPARSYEFTWTGGSPIRATLCWTDPPASALTGLDDPSPRLINDLDLRVVGPSATTYYPYTLDPSNPATNASTGDNTLDNVEQVFVASPGAAGTYTVQVSHKGTLSGTAQAFSLLITGPADAVVLSIATSSADPDWVDVTWWSAPGFTLYWTGDPPGGPQTWNAVDGAALSDVVDNGDGTWTWTDKGTDTDMGGLAPGDATARFYRVGVN
jgi:hypothetical protein